MPPTRCPEGPLPGKRDEEQPCGRCGKAHSRPSPVTWSPAFRQHLCPSCRAAATDAELRETTRKALRLKLGS